MGKRKCESEEEYLSRKMRKLERKMAKVRRKNNGRQQSESSLSSEKDGDSILITEVEQNQDSFCEDIAPTVATETVDSQLVGEDVPLDNDILNILGDEPSKEETFGASIHKDIAIRWSEILTNGLNNDTLHAVLKQYEVPENLKLCVPPLLNPEIKAAVNDQCVKRDCILIDKQKYLSCAISNICILMSNMLSNKDIKDSNQILKHLSDAGRLLCHLHYSETNVRRTFLMANLNKTVKFNIKDQKRDKWLFGAELSEKLRAMKAISKTGVEMRAVARPKAPQKSKQSEESTSRALNWRGPPPPPPPPQHAASRQSSTVGGRRQPYATPPAPRRSAPDRRRQIQPQRKTRRN